MTIADFEVWRPLLEYVRPHIRNGRTFSGEVDQHRGHSLSGAIPPLPQLIPGRAMQVSDFAAENARWEHVRDALRTDNAPSVTFSVEIEPSGETTIRAVLASNQTYSSDPDCLTLVAGVLPEPYRRLPTIPHRTIHAARRIWPSWSECYENCGRMPSA